MKEQIWMPNKNICECHLTLNRHSVLCIDTHACMMLKFICINKEKEIFYIQHNTFVSSCNASQINSGLMDLYYLCQ